MISIIIPALIQDTRHIFNMKINYDYIEFWVSSLRS